MSTRGIIIHFNSQAGYGFLARDDGADQTSAEAIFYHASAFVDIANQLKARPGRVVEFDTTVNRRDPKKLQAVNVRVVD